MITITIPDKEYFNENTNEYFIIPGKTIVMEHSLYAIRHWEAKWHKPYLDAKHTFEEGIDYFRFMTITKNVDPRTYYNMSQENVKLLTEYMKDAMTATTFKQIKRRTKTGRKNRLTTCELIYYWMAMNNIPFDCDKWHFNQLMTLIHVCSEEQLPPEKMSQREIFEYNKSINERNRARFNSKG